MAELAALDIRRSPLLAGLPHGFFGRGGGVSTGLLSGLNVGLGSNDARDSVARNRELVIEAIQPGAELVTLRQVHSPDVVTVTGPVPLDARPEADAMVTDRPGFVLGILTADCVPVLFADHQAGVIGAAHSGWKGAISGVSEATVEAMEALGADRARIVCAIGPCIAQKSYEVDQGFFARFAEQDPANERFFSAGKPGHYQFDIEGYVASRLAAKGIARVQCMGEDTCSQPDRYYSYRRSCLNSEPDYGRQISAISLPER